ncbi:hypothetical protein AArcMg_2334 [Natrarchaeobaculum sulfurireducens]|uniref:Uncharacterized protein n=1 Tax=Natrarchaeobaculum sulfurireducens TaxID=2044521 RepID=A0A346PDS9_9EURY|nr:hypothetical protein AArc1_1337 [Natrarchaeobaculum sulfurireducens]AXR82328.1 hypothetical protein AArcMg_2334 [Natrarchaeobaculum sulfurireducens]
MTGVGDRPTIDRRGGRSLGGYRLVHGTHTDTKAEHTTTCDRHSLVDCTYLT